MTIADYGWSVQLITADFYLSVKMLQLELKYLSDIKDNHIYYHSEKIYFKNVQLSTEYRYSF